jgi:hypothetical protein
VLYGFSCINTTIFKHKCGMMRTQATHYTTNRRSLAPNTAHWVPARKAKP